MRTAQRCTGARRATASGCSTTALALQDPSNDVWQITSAIYRWWQAQLAEAAGQPEAEALAAEAAAIFAKAHKTEPKNERIRNWLTKALDLQAQLALAQRDPAEARADLQLCIRRRQRWPRQHR